uniref:Tctex1 domain containing 2 n=1 Tax=Oryzias latipes TaxID=8090 RepID=A0A3P9HXX9_ORYLA
CTMAESSTGTYLIRPDYQKKFKPAIVKEFVHEIVRERLSGVKYEPEKIPETCSSLFLIGLGIDKYKIIVQVMIGEQRGQGVKMCSRFFWDADTDNYAEDVFMNPVLCGSSFWMLLLLRMKTRRGRRLVSFEH